MKYEFVHQRIDDWNFEEKTIINNTINLVLQVDQARVLEVLARHIYEITKVKYIIISQTISDNLAELSSLIFLHHGQALGNVIYGSIGAPCQKALSHSICYYPLGIQQEFPEALLLQQMGVHSYMGMALKDINQRTIGIITLLDDKTIENPGLVEHLLTIMAPLAEECLLKLEKKRS